MTTEHGPIVSIGLLPSPNTALTCKQTIPDDNAAEDHTLIALLLSGGIKAVHASESCSLSRQG